MRTNRAIFSAVLAMLGSPAAWAARPVLHALAFVTPQRGWIGGDRTILMTANGGRTWRRQYRGAAKITQLDFVNASDGWAVTDHALLRTTDGGRRWQSVGILPPHTGFVDFVTPRIGWAQVDDTLFQTHTAGQAWRKVATPFPIAGMTFLTATKGWIGNEGTPKVAETVNGSRTWRRAVTLPGATPQDDIEGQQIVAEPGGVVWDMAVHSAHAGGVDFDLSRSADGGRHWRKVHMGSPQVTAASPNALAAAGPNVAYVSGFCGPCDADKGTWLIFTRNGGRTGGGVYIPRVQYAYTQIVFPTPRDGWMLANVFYGRQASEVLKTTDGGLTWHSCFREG